MYKFCIKTNVIWNKLNKKSGGNSLTQCHLKMIINSVYVARACVMCACVCTAKKS